MQVKSMFYLCELHFCLVKPQKVMKNHTLGPPNYENRLPGRPGEDPEDPQEIPRPSLGRKKEPQRRL